VQNETDTPRYSAAAAAGVLATVRGCRMTGDDWTRARIIEALMCNFRVDLAAIGVADQFQDELALLRPMVNEGVLTISNGVIAMTAPGRTVVRVVASMFDAHRWTTHGQFSAAV
jgi:oxygen-independent coproporphyrinogen-3 oxidase